MAELEYEGKGGSAFYIIVVLSAMVGLTYLMLKGFALENMRMVVIGAIFLLMLLFATLINIKTLFGEQRSFGAVIGMFWLGFLAWYTIAYLAVSRPQSMFSSFSIHGQVMLSNVSQQLPPIADFFVNVISAPITEELFFLLTLPLLLFYLAGRIRPDFEKEPLLKAVVAVIVFAITAYIFVEFHTGQAGLLSAFGIAALVFRSIQLALFHGNELFKVLPGTDMLASFAIGAHMANNLAATGGITKMISLINEPVMMLFVLVLGSFIVVPILNLKNKFTK